ncbi:maltase-glucoamylase, intestinal [Corchorus olitorius]|uniref:Maltase-glucoamylase, intestinal n=1 Tax=Corchorus olitorius TaxID=93759 RepID=A0A1R3IW61_9ROSI|nr:maltase-glucoamylase, intestinal [Corchorus olitorius]
MSFSLTATSVSTARMSFSIATTSFSIAEEASKLLDVAERGSSIRYSTTAEHDGGEEAQCHVLYAAANEIKSSHMKHL